MLLPIKPICSAAKIRRDGTSLIFIQYCFSADNKTLLNTDIAIPPNFWHKKLNYILDDLLAKYGKAANLNRELQGQIRLAEDIISFGLEIKVIRLPLCGKDLNLTLTSLVLQSLNTRINLVDMSIERV